MGLGEPLFFSLARVFASEDVLEGDLGVRLAAAVLEDEAEDDGRGTGEFWLAELVELVFTALLRRTGEPPPLGVDGLVIELVLGFVIFVGAGNVVLLLVVRLWGRGLIGREDFSVVLLSVGVLGLARLASSSELLFERRLLLRTGDGGGLVIASLVLSLTIMDLGLYFGSADPVPELLGRRVDARVEAIIGWCCSLALEPLDSEGCMV